jgi:hypothetical protein
MAKFRTDTMFRKKYQLNFNIALYNYRTGKNKKIRSVVRLSFNEVLQKVQNNFPYT